MWKMQLCMAGEKPMIERVFEDLEEGTAWVDQQFPAMLPNRRFETHSHDYHQWGEGYYWVTFQRAED